MKYLSLEGLKYLINKILNILNSKANQQELEDLKARVEALEQANNPLEQFYPLSNFLLAL